MGVQGNVKVRDHEVLERANQFKKAAELLKCNNDTQIPMEVNVCFSCELYLKYLIHLKKNNVSEVEAKEFRKKKWHDLKCLYDDIGENDKELIKKEMGDEFERHLEKVKYNFNEIRYDYEYEIVTFSSGFLRRFMEVLSDICNN